MRSIFFARTRHEYDSYTDFWRLVEAARYPTCFVDEIDLNLPVTYITTPWNGETPAAIRKARSISAPVGKVIWWMLERDAIDAGNLDAYQADLALFDALWVSDRSCVNLHAKFEHVILGGHAAFGDPCVAKHYEVCVLAYLWGRRQRVVDELAQRGLKIAPEAFGRYQQDRFVATSQLMLNMHQYDTAKIIAPIRFAVAASYGLPLITEDVRDSFPLVEGRDFVSAPIEDLPDLVVAVLADHDRLRRLAVSLRSRLVLQYPFDQQVNRAVDQLWQRSAT